MKRKGSSFSIDHLVTFVVFALVAPLDAQTPAPIRPPAVPLVTIDPCTSCWSMGDRLYESWPSHWTGAVHAMTGMIRVDGKTLRFMGADPSTRRTVEQRAVIVQPTQTIYRFTAGAVDLTLTFTSPLLLDDLELVSRPVTYLTFEVRSRDGKPHDVKLYFDATAEWAVHRTNQRVRWSRFRVDGLQVMKIGTVEQRVLGRKGDNVRIDWGHLLVAAPADEAWTAMAAAPVARRLFVDDGGMPSADDQDMPRRANDRWPALAVLFHVGAVGSAPHRRHLLIGYDDIESIEFFHKRLKAWWCRDGRTVEDMLGAAAREYPEILRRCADFDARVITDLSRAGGPEYAALCSLVYRQAIAAHKLVAGPDGRPLYFSKECFSNGSIATVDVTYPSAPLFLIFNPTLVKGMLDPIFHYRESGRWRRPFAPHDVGTYPIANGQTYGGDMPVEESANMIILTTAISAIEQHAGYAKRHWESLTEWAQFLRAKGFDPENQLCTDDFAGHLAHNANLSIKAILALWCYGELATMVESEEKAQEYETLAKGMVRRWVEAAADRDHYSLTFDRKGTWSQKYNLAWDRVLGPGLFPPEVARKEIAHYLKVQNPYGLPLDSRERYTKSDWILWTATLAEDPADFETLIKPVYKFVNETPDRVPVSDWHWTHDGRVRGFRARSVVGGYFMKLLAERMKQKQ